MGVEGYVAKDLELENGVKQENEDSSECLSTCTNSKSCHSITYCKSVTGISVCYNHEKNMSIDVEIFDLSKVKCMDGFCASFYNCSTVNKICPRGLYKRIKYILGGILILNIYSKTMLFIITTIIFSLLS